MKAVEAQETITECCETIDKIKKERQLILEKQENFKSSLAGLEKDLGRALVQAMFGTEIPAEVSLIRKSIRDKQAFLSDVDLILVALDLLEAEKKEAKTPLQAIVRADAEQKRQMELNMSLQQQLLSMAAESEQFMNKPAFLKIAEQFKRNARSLNQEEMADKFLRTLREQS